MAAANTERVVEPLRPQEAQKPVPVPPRPQRGMPSMRTAVIWSEILGKPKARRGRR